jgi:DNA-binding Xre family transcriptional regulator
MIFRSFYGKSTIYYTRRLEILSMAIIPTCVYLTNNTITTNLLTMAGMSRGTLARFAKGKSVSMDIIEKTCKALDYRPGDIVEYLKDTRGR